MNLNKLSSDEVPAKFSEWLLAMGCPPDIVPSSELAAQMCRGQVYMVWRSLIENVMPRDDVKYKRLLVFTDDIQKHRIQKENTTPKPDELALWQQHQELIKKVSTAEQQVLKAQTDVSQLMDKVSSKLSHRNLVKHNKIDAQRRLHLLQQVSEELQNKKSNLQETVSIANSLCCIENEEDAEGKLEKCMGLVCRSTGRGTSTVSISPPFNMNSMSLSTVSTNSSSVDIDTDEHIVSLAKCGGDKLWPLLCERRAGLCAALMSNNVRQGLKRNDRITPESVLTNTFALHCLIALEATKNKWYVTNTKNRLAAIINDFNMYPTGDACEYLVVCCERIGVQARVNSYKSLMDDLEHRRGLFEADGKRVIERHAAKRMIINMDRAILTKKEDLKRTLSSLQTTEKKIDNIRECLKSVFTSLKDHEKSNNPVRYGDQIYPRESISKLRQFYEEKREKIRNKVNLSMEFELSDNSYLNYTDDGIPRFIDELKFYLNQFNLEKNRKLVFESGDKIWIFETLKSSLERLFAKWQDDEVICPVLCPSMNIRMNFENLINIIQKKKEMSYAVKEMEGRMRKVLNTIDITKISNEEKRSTDKTKKRLNESLLLLKDVSRTLNVGFENLEFWSKNDCKKYISTNRYIDGKTCREYEECYLEYVNI